MAPCHTAIGMARATPFTPNTGVPFRAVSILSDCETTRLRDDTLETIAADGSLVSWIQSGGLT